MAQPTESSRELVLWSRPGAARLEFDGRSQSLSLATGELLEDIIETEDGWIAAGRRARNGVSRIVLHEGSGRANTTLAAPEANRDHQQVRPRLITRKGRLEALTWLEGPNPKALAVRASLWAGGGWTPPVTVSAAGPGSQTGLAAATLGDGDALLVWSAFDGNDDEILYSLSQGDGFSTPARIGRGNRVPDIAPAVIATRKGALAAWSRFDGVEYELVVARLRRGRWQAPQVVATGGALFPEFLRRGEKILLVYRASAPRGWGVLEMNPRGGVERTLHSLATGPDRPALMPRDGQGVDLRWNGKPNRPAYWSLLR